MPFELVLSPQGHLHVREAAQPDSAALDGAVGKRIHAAFADAGIPPSSMIEALKTIVFTHEWSRHHPEIVDEIFGDIPLY